MTITSAHIFSVISHYQKTNGETALMEEKNTEALIEAMMKMEGNDYVTIQEIDGLGTGFYIIGHGCYFPNDIATGAVTFVTSV